jgi:hypothetical protein
MEARETRRNSEEVATCPVCVASNRREGKCGNDLALNVCRLGRHAIMENNDYWLAGNC